MVEYEANVDNIFSCLADGTRRDILTRVIAQEMNISQVALEYDMSIAAVSKHIIELEQAGLVTKRVKGRERLISFNPGSLNSVKEYIEHFPSLYDEIH